MRLKRVVLNATRSEVEKLGGDFSLYKDWRHLSGDGLDFQFIPDSMKRKSALFARKVSEKCYRRGEPQAIRRLFTLGARLVPLTHSDSRADLVFSHLLFPAGRVDIPVIWSSQGISSSKYYDQGSGAKWLVEDVAFLYSKLGERAAGLLISTQYGADNLLRLCPQLKPKMFVLHGPVFSSIDEAFEKPSERDGRVRFLFVGVDARRKGLPEALNAFAATHKKFPDITLDVVSRPKPQLRALAESTDGVSLRWSSPQVDVKSLMSKSDVLILPTRADTYALAAVEAMAHQCAVILSDIPPMPEIVQHGEAGFNVPIGDVHALELAMTALIEDHSLLRTMQQLAFKLYLARNSPDVVADGLTRIFDSVT